MRPIRGPTSLKMMNFFATGSPFLAHPLLTRERTVREIDFLLSQLHVPAGGRILDVGCGFGRHAIYLAELGYMVTAIDPAPAMIAAARAHAAAAGVKVAFHVADGAALQDTERFDLILCLFTTLGQINDGYADNRSMLPQLARLLKQGGAFVVEVPNRPLALAGLKAHDRFGSESAYTDITRTYDDTNDVVDEHFYLVSAAGERRFHLRYRLFNEATLADLLSTAGFAVRHKWGGYATVPLTDQPTMLFICEGRG